MGGKDFYFPLCPKCNKGSLRYKFEGDLLCDTCEIDVIKRITEFIEWKKKNPEKEI